MAENENLNQQAQQQAAEKERLRQDETTRRCKHCGTDLDEDSAFCPQCGEQFGSEEIICQFCDTKTTQEFCPHCGKRVIPIICPQCGAPSLFDACENCGALLNPKLAAFFTQEKPKPQEMNTEEARKIEKEFKQQSESPEFQKFQKRLIERQILLEERDYFKKREKRIIKVFGTQPFTLELPDPQEEAFRMKAYAALEKTVIERQEKLLQEEWERIFPEEKKVEVNQNGIIILKKQAEIDEENRRAELERKREEMESRYRELLSQVEDEVEAHRIAEEKRKEEERLRREEEERRKKEEAERLERERQKERERQRLEQEAYKNRMLGKYCYNCQNKSSDIYIESYYSAKGIDHFKNYNVFGHYRWSVTISGDGILLTPTEIRCPLSVISSFQGTINNSGTQFSGYWFNYSGNAGSYETFVKEY